MKMMTWKDISNRIIKDEEMNFLGRVITPLHLLGMEALLVKLQNEGIKCKGYIIAVPHYQTGMALKEDMFNISLYNGVEPVTLTEDEPHKDIYELFRLLNVKSRGHEFYLANPFKIELNYVSQIAKLRHKDNIKLIVTDEGTANYVRSPYRLTKELKAVFSKKERIRFFIEAGIIEQFWYKGLKRKGYISEFLLLNSNGKLVVNQQVVNCFKQVLLFGDKESNSREYEQAIVFCPSLLYEAGYLKARQDIEIYKRIQDIIGKEEKYVLKPHPREKNTNPYTELHCFIDNNYSESIESKLAKLNRNSKLIVGDSSTILVNAKVLFGINTISINRLISPENLADKKYFDGFNEKFEDLIFIPNTYEELEGFLSNIVDE